MEILIDDSKPMLIQADFDVAFIVLRALLDRGHTIKYKENGVFKELKENVYPKQKRFAA